MTDITDRIKEAMVSYEKLKGPFDLRFAKEALADDARTLLPEAIEEIEELRGKLAEMQSGQPYTYYGRDGKPVLARDLEDRAEAAEAKLATATEALERVSCDMNWQANSGERLNMFVFDYIDAALAEIGEKP